MDTIRNPQMKVVEDVFPFFNFVIVRFHIGFPGCIHETWDNNDSLSQWVNFMLSRKNTAFKRLYLRVHWLSEMNFHYYKSK